MRLLIVAKFQREFLSVFSGPSMGIQRASRAKATDPLTGLTLSERAQIRTITSPRDSRIVRSDPIRLDSPERNCRLADAKS